MLAVMADVVQKKRPFHLPPVTADEIESYLKTVRFLPEVKRPSKAYRAYKEMKSLLVERRKHIRKPFLQWLESWYPSVDALYHLPISLGNKGIDIKTLTMSEGTPIASPEILTLYYFHVRLVREQERGWEAPSTTERKAGIKALLQNGEDWVECRIRQKAQYHAGPQAWLDAAQRKAPEISKTRRRSIPIDQSILEAARLAAIPFALKELQRSVKPVINISKPTEEEPEIPIHSVVEKPKVRKESKPANSYAEMSDRLKGRRNAEGIEQYSDELKALLGGETTEGNS